MASVSAGPKSRTAQLLKVNRGGQTSLPAGNKSLRLQQTSSESITVYPTVGDTLSRNQLELQNLRLIEGHYQLLCEQCGILEHLQTIVKQTIDSIQQRNTDKALNALSKAYCYLRDKLLSVRRFVGNKLETNSQSCPPNQVVFSHSKSIAVQYELPPAEDSGTGRLERNFTPEWGSLREVTQKEGHFQSMHSYPHSTPIIGIEEKYQGPILFEDYYRMLLIQSICLEKELLSEENYQEISSSSETYFSGVPSIRTIYR